MAKPVAKTPDDIQEKIRGILCHCLIDGLVSDHPNEEPYAKALSTLLSKELKERDTEIRRLNALTVLLDSQLTDAEARLKESNNER